MAPQPARDDLRLAWLAEREGRPGRRDALLTLAVASAGPGEAAWADRVWRRLVAARPEHPFAAFATRPAALADSAVAEGLRKLRTIYPPGRVRRMLARADALRGPYTGRPIASGPILDDLLATPVFPRTHRAKAPLAANAAEEASPARVPGLPAADSDLARFYLIVLLAIAVLLEDVLRSSGQGSRAA